MRSPNPLVHCWKWGKDILAAHCDCMHLPRWCPQVAACQPFISVHNCSSLSACQQMVMTLMRLRLDLSGQDLRYWFGIHKSTVSHIFASVTDVLFQRLKHLIIWPDRDVLKKTLPMDYRKHCPNCTVIIDCFETFIDRPSDLLARTQTYSSYKHHNTVKYFIGITPNGVVSFISNGWGGKVRESR